MTNDCVAEKMMGTERETSNKDCFDSDEQTLSGLFIFTKKAMAARV